MPNQQVKYQEFHIFLTEHWVANGEPDTLKGIKQRPLDMAFPPLNSEDIH